MGREDEIRAIAYGIWEAEGYCHGYDCDHWLRAEVIWEDQHQPSKPAPAAASLAKAPVKATDRHRKARKGARSGK
jgi:hypothetical protein